MAVKDILRVLYEPHKVFKDIIKDPNYLGPMILLIIFVLAQLVGSYVVASRSFVEQTMPTEELGDNWTTNFQDWISTSGVIISNNTIDFIKSSLYYGPSSIEFEGSNLDLITIELASFGDSVNCGPEGFNSVSLRIKIISPDYSPNTASLTLHSLGESSFVYDLSDQFENDLGIWTNLTIPVGFGDWVSKGSGAVWENITGIKIDFSWSINSTINILVDGLFFRGDFRGPIELFGISYFASTAINAVAPFLFQWLLLTGFMYLLIKALKKEVLWRTLMVAVGFALVLLVIQGILLIFVYSFIPDIYYPLEVLAGIPGETEVAYQVILEQIAFVSNIGTVIQLAVYIWIIGIGVFITRAITELSWMKSLLVSGASLLLTIIVLGFLL